tara:strand:+ start:97 stop:981 length:885 start_codon:yes stop_codon:yes gene_type:complete
MFQWNPGKKLIHRWLIMVVCLNITSACTSEQTGESSAKYAVASDEGQGGTVYLMFRSHLTLQDGYLGTWELGPFAIGNDTEVDNALKTNVDVCDAESQIRSLQQLAEKHFSGVTLLADFIHDVVDGLASQLASKLLKAETTIQSDFECNKESRVVGGLPDLFQFEATKSIDLTMPSFKIKAKIYGQSEDEWVREKTEKIEKYRDGLANSGLTEEFQQSLLEGYQNHLDGISPTDSEVFVRVIDPTFALTSDPRANRASRSCVTASQYLNPGGHQDNDQMGEIFCKVDPGEDAGG